MIEEALLKLDTIARSLSLMAGIQFGIVCVLFLIFAIILFKK